MIFIMILSMQILDVIIYGVLAWYFSQVWPSKLGVSKPIYFPLLPSYWWSISNNHKNVADNHCCYYKGGSSCSISSSTCFNSTTCCGSCTTRTGSSRRKGRYIDVESSGNRNNNNSIITTTMTTATIASTTAAVTNSGICRINDLDGEDKSIPLLPLSSEEEIEEEEEGDNDDDNNKHAGFPMEPANESLLGPPTVIIHKLNKTYGKQKAVNDLSFNMYENQIFALLGHNGAGKVSF